MKIRNTEVSTDSLPYLVFAAATELTASLSTMTSRLIAAFWKIDIGSNVRFYGKPLFFRAPGSNIRIGADCIIRSARWSNWAGLNRRCMFATIEKDARIRIGRRVGLSGTVLCAAVDVTIEDEVMCGANVTILDSDMHPIEPGVRWQPGAKGLAKPVLICRGAWLGLNVIVCKGVKIGEDAVIAAGSVVVSDIPSKTLAGGMPAKVIREL